MRVRNPVSRPAMTRIKGFVAARLKLAFTKRAFFASALLIHWTRIYRNGMGGPITGVWTGPADSDGNHDGVASRVEERIGVDLPVAGHPDVARRFNGAAGGG